MDLRKAPKFRACLRLGVSCRVSSDWHLLKQCKGRRARVAQWYVYWEALDNIKGGGCWNVTTIDKKKHGVELPYLDTRTDIRSLIHAGTPPLPSIQRRRKTSRHRTGRDSITVCTSLFLHEKFTVTCMKEIFFVGTAKAIRCVSQQQNNVRKENILHVSWILRGQADWKFTLGSRLEQLLLATCRYPSERSRSRWRRKWYIAYVLKVKTENVMAFVFSFISSGYTPPPPPRIHIFISSFSIHMHI